MSLIVSNFVLLKQINKSKLTDETYKQKRLLTRMSILFTVTFGLRAIWQLVFYVCLIGVVKNTSHFTYVELVCLAYIVLDILPLYFFMSLNYHHMKE